MVHRTLAAILTRPLRRAQKIMLQQGNWTGTLVLAPEARNPQ